MITLGTDSNINHVYRDLLKSSLRGVEEPTRQSGVAVLRNDRIDLQRFIVDPGLFPFCLDRKIPLQLAWEEMLFFLHGKTQTKELEEKGIFFWKGNTTREFLDKRGLTSLEEGDMGNAYGFQWRHPLHDQLETLLTNIEESLKTGSNNRRMLVNLWSHTELHEMALPPCWWSMQVTITYGDDFGKWIKPSINLILNNRSLDIPFGFWFAVSQYRMLQLALAAIFKTDVGYLDIRMADQHVYSNQVDWAKELLCREVPDMTSQCQNTISLPYVDNNLSPLENLLSTRFEDFDIDYRFYNGSTFRTPRPPMMA